MPTNLQAALKKDFARYKKEVAALEKQKATIDKKIAAVDKKYGQVLALLKFKPAKTKKTATRAKRGQTKEYILMVLKKSKNPLKAFEIISSISASGGNVSKASIRQQLPKLTKEGVIKKDKNKAYSAKK